MDLPPSTHRDPTFKHATYVGPTTEADPELIALSAQHGLRFSRNSYYKRGSAIFAIDPSTLQKSLALQPTILESLNNVVGSYGPRLLELYRHHVESYLPVIEPGFLEDYYRGVGMTLDPLLLAALYTVALPWLLQEDETLSSTLATSKVEEMAFSLFSSSLANPSLATLQAGMLLIQRPAIDSKVLNSQLVNAAYDLGLHLDCTSWDAPDAEKALRKRLAWCLYTQDKWSSLIHGRPSLIGNDNWLVQDLSGDDFLPPVGVTSAVGEGSTGMLFRQMAHLTKILSTILDAFYSLKAIREIEESGNNGTRVILDRAKPIQISLKEWFGELPPALKMDSSNTNPSSATGTGFLHLAYFATEITLHRCIIRSLQTSSNDEYLAHICRSAAKTRLISAMDFVNRLRPEHLKSFWYFASSLSFALIGSFGSLLLATAPGQEEVEFYKTRLGEFRWTLGVSNRSAPFLTFAVENLDNLELVMSSLPERPRTTEDDLQSSPRKRPRNLSLSDENGLDENHSIHIDPVSPPTELSSNAPLGLVSPSTSVETSSTYDAFA